MGTNRSQIFQQLIKSNPNIEFYQITDEIFNKYGRVISNIDFNELLEPLININMPIQGNEYVASYKLFEENEIKHIIENNLYGEMPIQIGYCNGYNSSLNCLEYHKSNEILVAGTDLVLILGSIDELVNDAITTNKLKAFYISRLDAIEIYSTTLHFSPCKVSDGGFKSIIILPKGTNTPLENGVNGLLFAKNKWLIAHQEATTQVNKGAHIGIFGQNISINY